MSKAKTGKARNGQPMHYSVGALIQKDDKYLLIDRTNFPFGFAGLAGHINEGETKEQALFREVEEESGLKIKNYRLFFEEELPWNKCVYAIDSHYWYLFECEVEGELNLDKKEAKSIGWYSPEEIKDLKLEPVWEYWFKKLKII